MRGRPTTNPEAHRLAAKVPDLDHIERGTLRRALANDSGWIGKLKEYSRRGVRIEFDRGEVRILEV